MLILLWLLGIQILKSSRDSVVMKKRLIPKLFCTYFSCPDTQ